MKAFITGGSGFVGKNLAMFLLDKGVEVIAVSRSDRFEEISHQNFRYLSADTTQAGPWQEELKDVSLIVNLAGVSIFHYWSKRYKQAIYETRILTTRNLVEAIPSNSKMTLISASALGFYGNRGDDILSEMEPVGDDFLAHVCQDWEAEAHKAEQKGVRVAIARFGVVADKSGGAMKMMIPPFRFFVGGPLGDGRQFFPWIHLTDLIEAIWHLYDHENLQGTYNLCAPNPVRNREMSKIIGSLLHRPSFMTVPKFAIRLVIGELGSMVLFSQRGRPENLLASGFEFKYPLFKDALSEILG